MPAASVAVEQENTQLFLRCGVSLNRAMVLGLGIADDVINALLNLQKSPKEGCWCDAASTCSYFPTQTSRPQDSNFRNIPKLI